MSRKKIVSLVLISIVLLLTAVYNIQFEYLKYYSGLSQYVPTENEQEVIIYMGRKGYNCEFYINLDDWSFSNYDELDEDASLSCKKPEDEYMYPVKVIEKNGNRYNVEYNIYINKIDEEYVTTIKTTIDRFYGKNDEAAIFYYHIYAPYYDRNYGVQLEDNFTLHIGGQPCTTTYSDVDFGKDYLLNRKDITQENSDFSFIDYEDGHVENLEEEIKSCNNILDAGYGEAMYYDIIEPLEKEMSDIKKYSEEILN